MIDVRGLGHAYPSAPDRPVLHGIDLAVGDDEFVGVVGRNGSGKSTLARCLNGLVQPIRGSVTVDGVDGSDVQALRERVQLVFQNPENQHVGTTVYEDIAFGLANFGVPTEQMLDRAQEALDIVGLDVAMGREVATLSGGELQRLAVAGCLALRPAYLVLDEPTAMLDPGARAGLLSALAAARRARRFAVVMITHHLEDLAEAGRIVVVHEGSITATGTPEQIFADEPLLRRCGLEHPGRPLVERRPLPRSSQTPTVELRATTVGHGRHRAARADPVLHDVSLLVGEGELIAVAGPSGAGKSTLVSTVKGLLRPVTGEVLVDGVDPWRRREPQRFDRLGYVFQFVEHQLFAATVREDVAWGLRARHLPTAELHDLVDAALCRVGLDPEVLGDRSPFDLSGGEQRRAALAGVLVTDPQALILDEPTAGLDLPARVALFDVVHELRKAGTAVLWVTHRLEEVYEHADKLVVLDDGSVIAEGRPAEVLADESTLTRLGWPAFQPVARSA